MTIRRASSSLLLLAACVADAEEPAATQRQAVGASAALCAYDGIAATIYSQQTASGDVCLTAENAAAARAGYFDVGLPNEPYSACVDGIPLCQRGARKQLLTATELPGGDIKYHTACTVEDADYGTDYVATILSRAGPNGDACWTAATATGQAAGLWDRASYARCTDGIPTCVGSRKVLTASARRADGSVEYHTACVRRSFRRTAHIVATVYAEENADGSGVCLTAAEPAARAAGYFDRGVSPSGPYGQCAGGRARCRAPARRVVLAATAVADGRVKRHVACVLPGQPEPQNVVATLYSHDGPDAICLDGRHPAAVAAGYFDLGAYGHCDRNGVPQCAPRTDKVILTMAQRPNGSIKYQTACLATPELLDPTDGGAREVPAGLDFYGWYNHPWNAQIADTAALRAYTNTITASDPNELVALYQRGFRRIVYRVSSHGFGVRFALGGDVAAYEAAFAAQYRPFFTDLRARLEATGVMSSVVAMYVADEPALHRDVFPNQGVFDRYIAFVAAQFPNQRIAAALAQDAAGAWPRGPHFAPPPALDVMMMDPYFFASVPCDRTSVEDYLYRTHPNSALDWAFGFGKEVWLVGDAMLRNGQPPAACHVRETMRIAQEDPRITGLMWFVYSAAFSDGVLSGASRSPELLALVRSLSARTCE
ncbi:MAG: hypothetical protein RIT81_17665 [Deltaproteobacteria bacterium]